MTDYSRYEIEEFAEEMFENYRKNQRIDKLVTTRSFDSEKDGEKEFFQIGKRYSEMEGGWFDPQDHTHARAHMPEQITRNLTLGEFNFVVEKLKEFSESGQIRRAEIEDFNFESFCRTLLEFNDVTHVILPSDYRKTLMSWAWDRGLLKEDGLDYIFPGGVRIMFAHKEVDLENKAFVVNKDDLTVIQKKRCDKDLDEVEEELEMDLIDEYKNLGNEEELMLYFGESEEGKVDFLFRTILRVEEPSSNSSIGAIKLKS